MKFMNMKRFGSIVMAGALALSLTAPAFAATSTPAGQVIITGKYEDIPISVSVPTTGTAQINPYGLPVEVKKTVGTATITGQKITTLPMSIKNQGAVALNVNAGLTVTPKGELKVVDSAISNTETAKKVSVKLQVAALNSADYAVSSTDAQLEGKLIDKFAAEATWSGLTSANELEAEASSAGTSGQPDTAGAEAKSTNRLATLGAATVATGGLITYGNDSIALFRLTGDVAAEPTGGWKATDGFEAKVVFKFTPAVTYAVTVDSTISGGTVTVDKATAQAGDTVTATAVADSGKTLGTWSVKKASDGSDVTSSVSMSNGAFTMPAYAVIVSATFS